ncbi:S1 RNA-binding domain-containing protein [Agathobaculum sp. NSJ-28]|uniref:S1 RNA-binding domain-containing protein n=2 Tax=Agathobaculum TaxID=2048137 RepID=A0A923RX60_9FIRM|nr:MULTISPECIES: S1 RNA-binding domain-containing protein [Butyricicoccaceae]MBS6882298.1 S1 RNA-binding domain-containing protein [Clostridiaceae bacterium]SCJ08115.1 General stress protein 13 [uncultured Butyricicoccus sp.]MBC5725956.1 S1 RNA-binding domain-containing protein [Agathobaculum faecis]MCU6789179.1 S1 RNA-binding domain-containing protein [Agathobaculum ammoniilyticum]WOC74277.1 S1 RNA-binding domain-containing protein [Intestinibacillus sp. NTUH-41-i26]
MDLAVGAIVEGKVTGITKFGAFVALPEGKSGMVHISEVAASFVSDIKDFLQEGQQVKVKIINIDQAGRINLSIKKAQPQESRPERAGGAAPRQPRFQQRSSQAPRGRTPQPPKDPATMSFEDKLKAFMSDSESRQADVRHATDRKNGSRRRR